MERYRSPLPLAGFALLVLLVGCGVLGTDTPAPDQMLATPSSAASPSPKPTITPQPANKIVERIDPQRDPTAPLSPILDLEIVAASQEPVSLQMPAVFEVEVIGRDIIGLKFIVGRYEEDGTRRLMSSRLQQIPNVEQETSPGWSDGFHEMTYVWNSEGDYLSDGDNGAYILLQESDSPDDLGSVNGFYGRAIGSELRAATLKVNTQSGRAAELIDRLSGEPIALSAGEIFQITDYFLEEDGRIVDQPGTTLIFDDSGEIQYERRPLAGGDYVVGFRLENGVGEIASEYVNLIVGNENLKEGLRAYFDPIRNYQFLFPSEWAEPEINPAQTTFSNITGTLQLVVTNPVGNAGPLELSQQTLTTFGPVQKLYEDRLDLDGAGGIRTIYSYEGQDGAHTGILLVFSNKDDDFIIDFDGLTSEEKTALQLNETLVDSWLWRRWHPNAEAGHWQRFTFQDIQLPLPVEYQQIILANQWHRFETQDTPGFIAIRTEPETITALKPSLLKWLEIAARDVGDFAASDEYPLQLNDQVWQRVDFSYRDEVGVDWLGNIMGSQIGQTLVIAWLEEPEQDYLAIENEVYLISLASIITSGSNSGGF